MPPVCREIALLQHNWQCGDHGDAGVTETLYGDNNITNLVENTHVVKYKLLNRWIFFLYSTWYSNTEDIPRSFAVKLV